MPGNLGNFQTLQTQGRNNGASFAVTNPFQRQLAKKKLNNAVAAAKKGGRTRKMKRSTKGKSRRSRR
jgi:hypothetical protein